MDATLGNPTPDLGGDSWQNRKDLVDFKQTIKEKWFLPALAMIAGILIGFWPLMYSLPQLWTKEQGYYSHGMIVPLISAYVVGKNWEHLKNFQAKPFWPAILGVIVCLFGGLAASYVDVREIMSLCFVFALMFGAWTVLGGRWMMALALPIGYLLFMLPVWDAAIDRFTVPLQVLSSDVSYQMLQLLQLNPYKESATFIYLNNFTLNVGAPCSGLKLILSVTAFTLFFMMIAKLKFWGNLVLACITIPFCVLMNGIRITMIGIVGNQWGSKAGSAFHDYSGYIMLILCFFLLFKIARFLGWKD